MESTHGELCARLADGLRSDDAHRLTHIHQMTTTKIAAIALGAQAVACIAGECGTHLHLVDTQRLDTLNGIFIQQGANINHGLARFRVNHVQRGDAAQNTLTQRLNDFATFHQRFQHQTFTGTAIILDHHQILGNVHQTTGQVARVGRLQCRIGQTLACAVS